MVATRRERPDAVGACASGEREQGNGAGLGRGETRARWRDAWAGARGGLARAGGFAGALGRLRSWAESEAAAREGEKPFFICIFKEFLNANFQTLF